MKEIKLGVKNIGFNLSEALNNNNINEEVKIKLPNNYQIVNRNLGDYETATNLYDVAIYDDNGNLITKVFRACANPNYIVNRLVHNALNSNKFSSKVKKHLKEINVYLKKDLLEETLNKAKLNNNEDLVKIIKKEIKKLK